MLVLHKELISLVSLLGKEDSVQDCREHTSSQLYHLHPRYISMLECDKCSLHNRSHIDRGVVSIYRNFHMLTHRRIAHWNPKAEWLLFLFLIQSLGHWLRQLRELLRLISWFSVFINFISKVCLLYAIWAIVRNSIKVKLDCQDFDSSKLKSSGTYNATTSTNIHSSIK